MIPTPDRFTGPLLGKRFKLGPRFASSSQGRTRLAWDTAQARDVVVKELRLAEGGWKKFELFEREAEVLGQLAHRGIPRLVARFEEDGAFWLVMEKAPGATLKGIATRVSFAEADLRRILRGTLEILVYLHERTPPVIHRDLKPANVVMDERGAISVVDFGGVKAALREGGGTTVVGTFGYMAPEQLHGEATAATDLYGLGATIAALATRLEPEALPRKGLAMDLAKAIPSGSPGFVTLLARLCAPEPDARPRSAREVLRELDALEAGTPARAPEVEPAREAEPADALTKLPRRGLLDELGVDSGPLRVAMRVVFVSLGASGFAAISVARVALLPLIFAILALFARTPKGKGRFANVRKELAEALDEGRGSFRDLLDEGLRGLPPRRRWRWRRKR